MKLTSRQDIEAPGERVFAVLADFDIWERAALRRGIEVARTDTLSRPGPGMTWRAQFSARGKRRQIDLRLTRLDAPSVLGFTLDSALFTGTGSIEVYDLAASRSRVNVAVEIKPRTLSARLLMQSMRLARSKIERRFDARVAAMATDVENRLRGTRV